ncbi:hypothetical protein SAMN04488168_101268 [Bacillus sp. 491mf]|uniref:hypothetical protein n=1 Tax=Bacillus TaxID=1386 RepID=UPI0005546508|nr:hypothetical protein [Bacillus sp. UNC322MFChir4.1]SFB95356.1 hypothetical protein SAMN04488168_101268 [Bacillus sp. 491mf]
MVSLLKFLVTLIFVCCLFLLAFAWDKTEQFLNATIFKKFSAKWRKILLTAITILFELLVIWRFSIFFKVSVLESLVMGSILLLCCVWLIPYFVTIQRNNAKIADKYYSGGVDLGSVTVFRLSLNPLVFGTIILSTASIGIGIFYYLPYFL